MLIGSFRGGWVFASLLCAIGVFAVAVPAHALQVQGEAYGFWNSDTTGNKLTEICSKDWQPGYFDPCGAFLLGVVDGLAIGRVICPPGDVKCKTVCPPRCLRWLALHCVSEGCSG